jgi:hypothetical protein
VKSRANEEIELLLLACKDNAAADQAQEPAEPRASLSAATRHVHDYANRARLTRAA